MKDWEDDIHAADRRGQRRAPRGAGARRRESKVDRAYFALKQAIVSGALAPQILIDKNEWSARFAVSRLSITSAINRLAFERLVVIEPQRGSYVARDRLSDVKQWMLMRRALEMEVVAACAKELSERAIGWLGQNIAYQRAALDSGDLRAFTSSTPASIAKWRTGWTSFA